MRLLTIVAFVTILFAPASALADGFITPFFGYNFGGDSANCASLTNCAEKHLNFGISIGSTGGAIGSEVDLAYAKDFFAKTPGAETNVFTAMTNLVLTVPAGPVQPYLLGGVGLIRSHVSLTPSLTSSKNAIGYDIGGGVNVYFAGKVGVRGDIRRFHTLQKVDVPVLDSIFSGEKLDFWRASVGLTLKF